ncbi:glycosyltransferase family 39 protein [Pseudomonas chlororaphis]|uniref:glycosyltransferase family 39 protein n=1 Tax=Pseudomonas chlororaphis TaxID=587753 RepID=UPI0023689E4A|nr:glycosyltransferase family 39 protein [Pseudomonas chlororaphis]WDG80462.1 glycosyltransferase family 39 protein [Pseudomonas chlororaphis]WDG86484.1 glycosyltransferase family 39 protein [Pseudomonas chlororaphis]
MDHHRIRSEMLGVFLLALFLFTFGIWDQPAQGFDGRWWLFLQEMFRHGASLFPTTYGEPYPDYPGTATLFSYGFAQLFGAPNQLANILPTALASAGVLALLYRLLAPLDRTWALLAVLLTALTTQLLEKSRSVCLDQMVSLLCLGCFYLLHRGEQLASRWRQYAVFPLFVIAFAIRGPLGLIEVCGVACTYWALGRYHSRDDAWLLARKVIVHGVIGLLLLAACWWLLMQLAQFSGGEAFARQVYQMQVSGRLDESGEPFYFYFQLSLYRYFPVVPLALATLFVLRRQWSARHTDDQVQLLVRLGACGLMLLLGLSVPHFKRAYYILPMVPMFAAVAAYGLLKPQRWLVGARQFYLGLVALLPGLCVVVLLVCRHSWQKHGYWPALSLPLMIAVFIGLQGLALYCWRTTRDLPGRRLVLLSLLALAAQWWLLVKVVEPAKDLQFDTRGFVGQVEQLRGEDRGTLVFLNLGKDTWAVRYMMNLDHDEQPRFISKDDLSPLGSLPRPAWVILARKDQALLAGTALEQATPVFEGRLNNNPCLVFQLQ